MTEDLFIEENSFQSASFQHNIPEISVKELSSGIKNLLENSFSRVRVRGEATGCKLQGKSGHFYFGLQETGGRGITVLSAVIWKGVLSRLDFVPEDGQEIIITGSLTTFGSQSKYQLVVESVEMAGLGALLQRLEALKQKLMAEGLLSTDRKKLLPAYPFTIGVITSPTGAVIQDILHRVGERWPHCRVLLWPVAVQGQTAAKEVSEAVRGFNRIETGSEVNNPFMPPRPDVLIVARGGGSFEDLLPFSDELVLRAVAESNIPVVSGVGHDPDTMLIDFVADVRAATPTNAAERVTPVASDVFGRLGQLDARLQTALRHCVQSAENRFLHLKYGLGDLDSLLVKASHRLEQSGLALKGAFSVAVQSKYDQSVGRLEAFSEKLNNGVNLFLERKGQILKESIRVLETLSHKATLKRGFSLVYDAKGHLVKQAGGLSDGQSLQVMFHDGGVQVRVSDAVSGSDIAPPKPEKKSPSKHKKDKTKSPSPTVGFEQGDLFS